MDAIDVRTSEERAIPAEQVLRHYRTVGWWPERTADDIAVVLSTAPAVGAWRNDRLVGFARAITDGRLRGYLEDVLVDPSERRTGMGSALIRRLEDVLAETGPLVTLFCGTSLVPFYESLGYRSTTQVVLHHQPD